MISSANSPIDRHIGQRVQLARAMLGYEADAVAKALGISEVELRAMEAGGRIGADALFALAKILEKPVSYFYDGLPNAED
jgi:transcriptional regulator with XRE-family HTH domain